MANTDNGETVKSAVRALDILEMVVRKNRPTAANEIATTLAIPVSSLSYLLTTLQKRDYLKREGRRYVPGPALHRLQPHGSLPSLKETVDPLVKSIGNQLNETVAFFIRKGFEMESVSCEIGQHALRYSVNVGDRAPLHSFSAGKALLAAMRDDQIKDYLQSSDRRRFTANTVCGADDLLREIAEIRACGVAHTREEHTPGICGIGKAVIYRGAPLGALSVAIPIARYSEQLEERVIDLLNRAAKIIGESEFAMP